MCPLSISRIEPIRVYVVTKETRVEGNKRYVVAPDFFNATTYTKLGPPPTFRTAQLQICVQEFLRSDLITNAEIKGEKAYTS